MLIEMIYSSDGVIIVDNGKLITSGNTPQHYVTAKNAYDKCVADGYEVNESESKNFRKVTLSCND